MQILNGIDMAICSREECIARLCLRYNRSPRIVRFLGLLPNVESPEKIKVGRKFFYVCQSHSRRTQHLVQDETSSHAL